MTRRIARILSGTGGISCVLLIAIAYYLQWNWYLSPCPLCLVQRFFITLLGVSFFITWLHHPQRGGYRVYGGIITLLASIGLFSASRQVWLQHLPEAQQSACGASLEYMLSHLPLHQTILAVFQGTTDCAKVVLRLFGLSIPEWSLLFFIIYFIIGLYFLIARLKLTATHYRS